MFWNRQEGSNVVETIYVLGETNRWNLKFRPSRPLEEISPFLSCLNWKPRVRFCLNFFHNPSPCGEEAAVSIFQSSNLSFRQKELRKFEISSYGNGRAMGSRKVTLDSQFCPEKIGEFLWIKWELKTFSGVSFCGTDGLWKILGKTNSWFPKQLRKKSVNFFEAGDKVGISNFMGFSLKFFVKIPVKDFGWTNVPFRESKVIQCCLKPCLSSPALHTILMLPVPHIILPYLFLLILYSTLYLLRQRNITTTGKDIGRLSVEF